MKIFEIIDTTQTERPTTVPLRTLPKLFPKKWEKKYSGTEQQFRDYMEKFAPGGEYQEKTDVEVKDGKMTDFKILQYKVDGQLLGSYNYEKNSWIVNQQIELGRGLYAAVKRSTDPHQVVKKTLEPSRQLWHDAFYTFVDSIRPYMASNPYFPYIYNINIKRDPAGKVRPDYEMQTLFNTNKFDWSSIAALLAKINPQQKDYVEKMLAPDSIARQKLDNWPERAKSHAENLFNDIVTHVGRIKNDAVDYYQTTLVTQNLDITEELKQLEKYLENIFPDHDKNLLSAVAIIVILKENNTNLSYDFHSGNFMLRGTAQGPQLVFTDPLADF